MSQRNSHDSTLSSLALPVVLRALAPRGVLVLVLVLLITSGGAG